MKKIILLVAGLILMAACQRNGTDTGNPATDPNNPCSNGTRCAFPYPGVYISGVICEKLNGCFAIEKQGCSDAVRSQAGLQFEIDYNANTLTELDSKIRNKEASVDWPVLSNCLKSIDALTCDSTTVSDAFSTQDLQDFSRIHRMLQAHSDCRVSFLPKAAL